MRFALAVLSAAALLAHAGGASTAGGARRPALARLRGGTRVASAQAKAAATPALPKRGAGGKPLAPPAGPPRAGLLTVLGGLLLHMTLGTMYCWGSFIGYLPPSMRFFDGGAANGRQPDALLVIPLLISSQMLAMPLGARLNKKVGARNAMLIGALVMNLGIVAASYATSLLPFILGYSLLFGTGVGLGYTAPMQAGWGWFPRSKGLVNGIVLLGFGFGARDGSPRAGPPRAMPPRAAPAPRPRRPRAARPPSTAPRPMRAASRGQAAFSSRCSARRWPIRRVSS